MEEQFGGEPVTSELQATPAEIVQPPAQTGVRVSGRQLLATAAAAALLAGGVGGVVGYELAGYTDVPGNNVHLTQAAANTSARAGGTIAAIASKVTPSVVAIRIQTPNGSGTGSGFVIDARGYILTNNHVVEEVASYGGSLNVDLADGSSYKATIIGRNAAYDLAVIKIDASGLQPVTLGDSKGLVVGDTVVAVGAPLGLEGTVTSGIVSALNRPVTTSGSNEISYISAIQTDAAINPGNSGGPLVNAGAQVIGINSSIATMSSGFGQSGSIGLGFAIPIDQARRIAEELINDGRSTIPVIGVQVRMDSTEVGGVLSSVDANGPAAKAGLKAGDVVTAVDGRVVRDSTELIVAIRAHAPGDRLQLKLSSGETIELTLGSKVVTS